MSDKDKDFHFNPEEKPLFLKNRLGEEKFPFFLKALSCLLFFVSGFLFISSDKNFKKPLNPERKLQSMSPAPFLENQELALDSFFILLKSNHGPKLTKLEVLFQINNPEVLAEVKHSISRVKDHIVFILSNQNVSVFLDSEKKLHLEQKIIHQLNLFLVSGQIENLILKKTFLSSSDTKLTDFRGDE